MLLKKSNFEKKLSSSNNHVVSSHLLTFINLKKMSTSSNRKATKFKPTKNLKKSQMSSPWKNQRNAGAKVLIIQGKYITYLAANNELLSKRVKELNG